ncbi:NAD(P)-binding protein [Trichoderma citrinoviride]|uniref:NAD(P)-binding protein n=1 Tax=Trichoderma citrinoviride TaxID=58853 RepID=A0A2T4BBS4_9HYPO|nr:NAD(P)-binding protein [Trichoderma citrinoviride]PTB66765.1 NAD(P)-binding protein [Trichoderma citrinoviride]
MAQVYLISGASTGFGALAARAIAKRGHTVFAGMYSHSGNTKEYEDAISQFAQQHKVDLRAIPLDLLSQASVDEAVSHILKSTGRIDAIVHNAGHLCWGPSESFSAKQLLHLYDVNVVGCQRLNQAALPHMRRARSGHLIWICSSSTYGAKSPMAGPYFAAKAAQDALAQSYAAELAPWGIETTIVLPGVFVKGTNHFIDAAKPELKDVEAEYESGPTKGMGEETMTGTARVVPQDAEPSLVADALADLSDVPRGKKPFRVSVDVVIDGGDVGAAVIDNNKVNAYRRMGLERYVKVQL